MLQQLEEKIEREAQTITVDFDEMKEYPKGYLDGILWAYDIVLMWIKELSQK